MTGGELVDVVHVALIAKGAVCCTEGVLRSSRCEEIAYSDERILPRSITEFPFLLASFHVIRDFAQTGAHIRLCAISSRILRSLPSTHAMDRHHTTRI